MDDDQDTNFNFWPAFSDQMLAVILVLLLLFGSLVWRSTVENVPVREARRCEEALGKAIQQEGEGVTATFDPDDPFLLRISFRDRVLFASGRSELTEHGQKLLGRIGDQIRLHLPFIVEIQINGHADTRPLPREGGNLQLASERANRVFEFLCRVGIDPAVKSMSAASYGEFFPTGRRHGFDFGAGRLEAANATETQRELNRRVELLLRYGQSVRGCSTPQ